MRHLSELREGSSLGCPTCGAENEPGRKFCGECGTRLARTCAVCGFANGPTIRFCGECGSGSTRRPQPVNQRSAGTQRRPGPGRGSRRLADRRRRLTSGRRSPTSRSVALVSVLFADLVGFTARSDGSDPEQVREFLSSYFETARDVIERYGGTVEKFIGDAVMAVWGTPVALEDDAERAVRAALELVEAVRRLGRAAGDECLELRAGVLTGEAAVTLGATNQGMVAGDLVNTAVATPVGRAARARCWWARRRSAPRTRRSSSSRPASRCSRASRPRSRPGARCGSWPSAAAAAGSEGLEAPFVGRDDELRLLKDAYHATLARAEVAPRVGHRPGRHRQEPARLGVLEVHGRAASETVYWHQGRQPCVRRGHHVLGAGRDGPAARRAWPRPTTRPRPAQRIAETLASYVPDETERRWIEPAPPVPARHRRRPGRRTRGAVRGLAHVLRADRRAGARRCSSSRTSIGPTRACSTSSTTSSTGRRTSRSSSSPSPGPSCSSAGPAGAPAGATSSRISLEPLSEPAMRELLAGLVPGLPETAVAGDRGAGGRHPAVRGRDGPDARRRGPARGRRRRLPAGRRPRRRSHVPRAPGARSRRVSTRSTRPTGPCSRTRRSSARRFTTAALAAVTGDARRSLEARVPRARPARDPHARHATRGRPSAASTASSRRSSARSPTARWRAATAGRAPRRGALLRGRSATTSWPASLATHYLAAHGASHEGPEAEAVAAQARIALRGGRRTGRSRSALTRSGARVTSSRRSTVTTDPAERGEICSSAPARRHPRRVATTRPTACSAGRSSSITSGATRSTEHGSTARLGAAYLYGARVDLAIALLEPAGERFTDLTLPAAVEVVAQLGRAYYLAGQFERGLEVVDRAMEAAETARPGRDHRRWAGHEGDRPELPRPAVRGRGHARGRSAAGRGERPGSDLDPVPRSTSPASTSSATRANRPARCRRAGRDGPAGWGSGVGDLLAGTPASAATRVGEWRLVCATSLEPCPGELDPTDRRSC